MASALIQERSTVSGNQWRTRRIIEQAGQSFLQGTPLMLNNVTGALQAWDGLTIANGIAGISKEFGANLTTTGTAQQQSFGSVPNETLAKNYSRPYFNDGQTGIIVANTDNVFYAQCGPAQTTSAANVGQQYGMTLDTDGHWYVDFTKTGVDAVCEVVQLDYWDTARGVIFVFLASASAGLA